MKINKIILKLKTFIYLNKMSYKRFNNTIQNKTYNKENFAFQKFPNNYINTYNTSENFIFPQTNVEPNHETDYNPSVTDYPKVNPNYVVSNITEQTSDKNIDIKYEIVDTYSTSSPQIFGPPLWFSLHNAAVHYPYNPSPITRERMKNIILGIPLLTPCVNCSEHASAYIESNYEKLDQISSGKDPLFKFFVDFHNYVNERYNKPIMSYDEAYKIYLGNAKITKMSYS